MKYRYYSCTRLNDIRQIVKRSSGLYAGRIAFKELDRDKNVIKYTYEQLEHDMDALGTALLELGFAGYHVALLGENSYAWVVSYLAVVNGVGVAVPLDKELPGADVAKLLRKSDADAVICSQTYAPVIESILGECQNIKACIVMGEARPGFLSMGELIAKGEGLLQAGDQSYLDKPIDATALCEIIFTSGTTGANKGVMLSHHNIASVVYGMLQQIRANPVSLSVLPVSHSYECTCHVLGGIYSGCTLCFNDSLKHVMDNMRLFKPGMSLMVPLFLETMHRQIWKEAEKANLAGHLRYGIALSNVLRKVGIDLRRLYFKPVLEKFGGELRQIVCGGAPLRAELIKAFDDLGINVVNGYGITECAPVISTNCTAWKKLDSVGRVLPVCHVRIGEPDAYGNGEVLVKGDIVMLGYYHDEESTRASFTEDGYFKTGDLGRVDRRGFLYLNGRKKNLIVLSNGKNVCPEEIEEEVLGKIPYVSEIVVYSRAACAGIESIHADVYLDQEFAKSCTPASVWEKLNGDILRLNSRLPPYKRIQSFKISETEFEKTTTRKIKRHAVLKGGESLA